MTDQTGPQDNQTDPQTKIDKINDKLDEFASKASGPDVTMAPRPDSSKRSPKKNSSRRLTKTV